MDWVDFLQANGRQRLTLDQLQQLYLESLNGVHEIDEASTLSQLDDSVLDEIVTKVNGQEVLTDEESELWLKAFRLAVSDDYHHTKEELLNKYDWWLKRIEYHSGVDSQRWEEFQNSILKKKHRDVVHFLTDVTDFFSIEELNSVGLL